MAPKSKMMGGSFSAEVLTDPHTHLREGPETIADLVRLAIEGGAGVLGPMPNTAAGLKTAEEVRAYRQVVRAGVPRDFHRYIDIIPIALLNEATTPEQLDECAAAGIRSVKIYPRGRTTQSDTGVRFYGKILPLIKHCGEIGIKCHFHPEHPCSLYTNRDAEFAFLPIVRLLLEETDATIIWEHGTDGRCIEHWKDMATSARFYVTLTPHHLAINEDAAFGDVRATCKPPIKTERDRLDLIALVAEDHSWAMAGSDSAPHPLEDKHPARGRCKCGAFVPFALQLYAHSLNELLYTEAGREIFIRFTSRNGLTLHGLNIPSRVVPRVILSPVPWTIPLTYDVGGKKVMPFMAGETLGWSLSEA